VQADICVWRYALLVLHARTEKEKQEQKEEKEEENTHTRLTALFPAHPGGLVPKW